MLSPGEAMSGVLCPVLGSPVKQSQGTTGDGPVEDCENNEGSGAPVL